MFCWIFKRKISQSHDLNISLSGLTVRHISRCSHCRYFDRSLHALTNRLRRSVTGFLQDRNHDLAEKVMTGLVQEPMETGALKPRRWPVFAAAASMVLIVAGLLVLFQGVPMKKSPPEHSSPLVSAADISPPSALKGIVSGMESTFELELKRLGQHLKSATRSLADGFKLE